MKIKLTWQEFVDAATSELNGRKGVKGEPVFRKLYGHEPEGDHYDFPDFVEYEI